MAPRETESQSQPYSHAATGVRPAWQDSARGRDIRLPSLGTCRGDGIRRGVHPRPLAHHRRPGSERREHALYVFAARR